MSTEERIEDHCHMVVFGLVAAAFVPWAVAPPYEHWISLGPIAWLAGSLLAVVLSVLDIGKKSWPRVGRAGLTMAVVGVLVLGAWNAADQTQKMTTIQGEMSTLKGGQGKMRSALAKLTEENSYTYIHSRSGQTENDSLLLNFRSIGGMDEVNIGLHKVDKDKKSINIWWLKDKIWWYGRKVSYNDDVVFPFKLPIRIWDIHFRTKNAKWNELLEFRENDGVLTETITITWPEIPGKVVKKEYTHPMREISDSTR